MNNRIDMMENQLVTVLNTQTKSQSELESHNSQIGAALTALDAFIREKLTQTQGETSDGYTEALNTLEGRFHSMINLQNITSDQLVKSNNDLMYENSQLKQQIMQEKDKSILFVSILTLQ